MEFQVLGSLRAFRDGRPVPLPAGRPSRLLAMLLLDAGRSRSTDRLIDGLWDDEPPPTAREQVHNSVSALRRAFGDGGPLHTEDSGYRLDVAPAQVDALAFAHGVESAAALARSGRPAAAAETLRAALARWRGPALDGLRGRVLESAAARLDGARLDALETYAELCIEIGEPARAARELESWVDDQPYRERLVDALMLALYRTGRPADALEVYRRVAARLADELGVDPSPALRERHLAILRNDPRLDPAPAPAVTAPDGLPAVPAQLRRRPSGFTGRDEQLLRLDAIRAGSSEAATVVAVTGTAGVGKTALAVHWAHRVRHQYPDGQLYENLTGYGPVAPARPVDVLARMLRALGVAAGRVPADPDEAAALFRTLSADRRLLVLLDNARDPDQVRPLLPDGPGCLVVVTSRDRLLGLLARDGAHRVPIDVLDGDAAGQLIGRVIGAARAAAEPAAIADLARVCAGLPLALRIAAAHLTETPDRPVAGYVADLARRGTLAGLVVEGDEGGAVQVAFDHSYAALAPAARQLFGRLGLAPGPDLSTAAVTALSGAPAGEVTALLDRLAAAHLLDRSGDDRWSHHDLLRSFAVAKARDVEDTAAVVRLYDHYRDGVRRAGDQLYPHISRVPATPSGDAFGSPAEALAWLEAELPNLVAAVAAAAGHGLAGHATAICDGLRGFFLQSRYTAEWSAIGDAALAAATDPLGEAAVRLSLGNLAQTRDDRSGAVAHLTRAADLCARADWPAGRAAAHNALGSIRLFAGDLDAAAGHYAQALQACRRVGNPYTTASGLNNLALVQSERGRLRDAVDHLGEALAVLDPAAGDPRVIRAGLLGNRGSHLTGLGRYADARVSLDEALLISRELGSPDLEASVLDSLAVLHRDTGHPAEALDLAEAAMATAIGTAHRRSYRAALVTAATVRHALGQHRRALDDHTEALRLAREADDRHSEIAALLGRSAVHRDAGRAADARSDAAQAAARADQFGYAILHARARLALAEIELADGQPDLARWHAAGAAGSEHAATAARAAELLAAVDVRS